MSSGGRLSSRWLIATATVLFLLVSTGALLAQETTTWTVAPEPTVEIGQATGAPEYLFQSVRFARLLPDGRIVVADAGQGVIRIFGPNGEFRQELGGKGQGPGEFQSIHGLWLTPQENIGVWDGRNQRITLFEQNGDLVRTHSVRTAGAMGGGNLEVFFGSFRNGDIALASLGLGGKSQGNEAIPDEWMVGRFSLQGEYQAGLGKLRGMRRVNRQPIPFTPLPYAATHQDSLYVTDGYEAKISVIGPKGTRARTIRLPDRDLSPNEAWSSLEPALERAGEDSFLNLMKRIPEPERLPQLSGLLIDDRGRIWVKRYNPPGDALWLKGNAMVPAPGGLWQGLNQQGQVVAEVPMPDKVLPFAVYDNRLLGLSRDSLGVERIVIHPLRR